MFLKGFFVTFGAEAPLPVSVVVGGGGAPLPPVSSLVGGAVSVGLLHGDEGEHTHLSLGRHCNTHHSKCFSL